MKPRTFVLCATLVCAAGVAFGCGQDSSTERAAEKIEAAEQAAERAAETVGDHVENAGEVLEEGYGSARKQGESPVEAAGDAYNEVLEVPEDRQAE